MLPAHYELRPVRTPAAVYQAVQNTAGGAADDVRASPEAKIGETSSTNKFGMSSRGEVTKLGGTPLYHCNLLLCCLLYYLWLKLIRRRDLLMRVGAERFSQKFSLYEWYRREQVRSIGS
mmetsp:Transcript_11001/g.18443  ORF Transcript_11001/g.18443 Transcript_11001/m.18443 type:complete len:119 (-) Transcript_11001:96-452(-)